MSPPSASASASALASASASALALAFAFAFAFAFALPHAAHASTGPGCDAGAPCPDQDGDGFPACACAPPGSRCDCDDTDPATYPGAPESCNSPKDRNCNGSAPDTCGPNKGCLQGACVPECVPLDDFGCAPFAHCETQPNAQRLCVAPDCTTYGCPPGSTCDDTKLCIDDCNPGVRCPAGQRCRGFGCVDPCDGVVCAAGATCSNGICMASCDCSPGSTGCPAGQTCDRTLADVRCVDSTCAGVACAAGSRCTNGTCTPDCAGVVCPPRRVCKSVRDPRSASGGGATRAECIDLCAPNPCASPLVCDWRTGGCLQPTFPEAGLTPFTPLEDEELFAGGAGLTCSVRGAASAAGGGAAMATGAGIVLWALRRRRRRRRRRR